MYLISVFIALCTGIVVISAFLSEAYWLAVLSVASGFAEVILLQLFVVRPIRKLLAGQPVTKGFIEVRWLNRELGDAAEKIAVLKMKSSRDELTGLFNRTYLSMQQKFYERRSNMFVLSLDVNNLKLMNDTFGHEAGDSLLRNAANVLGYWNTYGDVYRMGGDEFMVVLCNKSLDECMNLLNEWDGITRRLNRAGDAFECRFAYGYAYGRDLDSLSSQADQMMYEKKAEIKGERGR